MIELTELEALGYIGTIFSAGAGVGFTVGYKMLGKSVVTSEDIYCDILSTTHRGNPKLILINGKRTNTNCPEFRQSNKRCRINGKICKFLD